MRRRAPSRACIGKPGSDTLQHHDRAYDELDDDAGLSPADLAALPRDERHYITPATDGKGVSARFQFRAMPVIDRLLSDVLLSRKFPFRSKGDIMCYCVSMGVRDLLKRGRIASVYMQADALRELLVDELFQIQFREIFNAAQAAIEHYLSAGAKGQARRVVALMRSRIVAMEEGYWRDRYEADLLERYGTLLDGDGAAPLSLLGEGDE